MQCGLPIETHVTILSPNSPPRCSVSPTTLSPSNSVGIFFPERTGAPISTLALFTLPSSPLKTFIYLIPLSVSSEISSLFVRPRSHTYFATHLVALPHIFALEPSALYISILKSALSLGSIKTSPSEPIPKCLSLTFIAVLSGSETFSSKQFTYI